MKALHTTTAVIELGAGVALLAAPSLGVQLLLAEEIPGTFLPLVRLAGTALLALGVACWLARSDSSSPASKAVTAAMTVYNIGAVVILGSAGIGSPSVGILLWPAVILHAVMSGWCVSTLIVRK